MAIKVLHTLDSLNRGGTETLMLDVCRNAKDHGIDLTFVATGGGNLEEEFEESGVDYIRLQRKYPIDPFLVSKLRSIIVENEIKIVHSHQPVEALHLYLATIGLRDVKCVLTHHGGGLIKDKLKNRLAARFTVPRMDANIACGNGLLQWLEEEIGLRTESFVVVQNGVDTKRLASAGSPLRKELGVSNNTKLAGMVANFMSTKTKDQLTVCRALSKVLSAGCDVHFVFVGGIAKGGHDYYERCEEYCRENQISHKVSFVGARKDVPDILHALDLFVFSTLHEGLPISLMEAMLTETAVIASDIEPNLEATRDGEFGLVFKTGDAEDLAVKMTEILNSPQQRANIAKKGGVFAAENFTIGMHLRKLRAVYEGLI